MIELVMCVWWALKGGWGGGGVGVFFFKQKTAYEMIW